MSPTGLANRRDTSWMLEAVVQEKVKIARNINAKSPNISSTTIESRKFRIPSDLRRQPGYRPVSSKVGDHLRILLGVVVHFFLSSTSFPDVDLS